MKIEETRERWTPGGQADWDQLQASAIEKLRETRTFVLAYVTVRDDGNVDMAVTGGNCETILHSRLLYAMLDEAMERMRDTLSELPEDA